MEPSQRRRPDKCTARLCALPGSLRGSSESPAASHRVPCKLAPGIAAENTLGARIVQASRRVPARAAFRTSCVRHGPLRCRSWLACKRSRQPRVNLGLDDIDWLAGTLRIGQNKSRRVHLLPLPQATGSAIANYLRSERPDTANRRVFVRHVAPFDVPIGSDVVRNAIRAAYGRCAINNTRVYALRHTLASRLLNEGGTLKEVADVLRHRDLDTTLIYAKVDAARLSAVAMPWPGSAA